MLTYQDIYAIAKGELMTFKRYDEYICPSVSTWAKLVIRRAKDNARDDPKWAVTSEQAHRFKKYMLHKWRNTLGNYQPKVNLKQAVELNYQGKIDERFGIGIAAAWAIDRAQRSNTILILLGSIARKIYGLYKKPGFSDDLTAVRYIQRDVRITVAHERRHKEQYTVKHTEGRMLLTCKSMDRSIADAKEDDANWWAGNFIRYAYEPDNRIVEL